MFGGVDDQLSDFLLRGCWYCWDRNDTHDTSAGYRGNSVEVQQQRFLQISPGDRIAIKKVTSIPNQEMEVRAIGIVTAVDHEAWRVSVNWLPIIEQGEPPRIVDLKGCVASIHGPFQNTDTWVREIFHA